jgi:hypothetical protein
MKNCINCTLLFLFVFSVTGFAQINFQKGYFINNTGEQVNCLIKNVDWKDNPTVFKYKLSETSEINTNTIKNVSEFVIIGISKYVRANVGIDRSSSKLSDLSPNRAPEFKEEELFLKVLIEGDRVLYRYNDNLILRFFYKKDSSKIKQLVYKLYSTTKDGNSYFGENEMFRQQLFNNVNCESKPVNSFLNISYRQKSLMKVFSAHNECNGGVVENYNQETKSDWFNLRFRPGANYSSLKIKDPYLIDKNVDFGAKASLRLGVELEFVLPFNNNKWSLFVEPTYQYYKNEKKNVNYTVSNTVDYVVDYKSIEVPVGLRYKIFINDKLNVFFNTAYVYDFEFGSKITRTLIKDLEVNTRSNIVFGIGGEFVDKFSFEFRVGTSRNLIGDNVYRDSKYNTSSIIFGYKLF